MVKNTITLLFWNLQHHWKQIVYECINMATTENFWLKYDLLYIQQTYSDGPCIICCWCPIDNEQYFIFFLWQFCMNMFLKSAISDLLVHVYIRIEKSNVISVPFDDNIKLHKNHTVWHIYRFIPFHIDQDETI